MDETIQAIIDASQSYEDWSGSYDADDSDSDGMAELAAVKDAWLPLLESLPGVDFVSCDYDSASSYFDLHFGDDEELQIRVSNHAMAYNGPFASFTTTMAVDEERFRKTLEIVLAEIEAEIASLTI